jgi:hypothetical protein
MITIELAAGLALGASFVFAVLRDANIDNTIARANNNVSTFFIDSQVFSSSEVICL